MPITPIIDTTAIKNNIAAFIQAVCGQTSQGTPVTWAFQWQEDAKPIKPYAVFKITGPRKIGGLDELRVQPMVDSEGNIVTNDEGQPLFGQYNIEGEREFTVSIECGSNDELATKLATNLETALEQPQFYSFLEQGGQFAVRGVLGVHDVTALLADSTKYERRVVLEFTLVAVSIALYGVGGIKEAQGIINSELPSEAETQIPLDAKTS